MNKATFALFFGNRGFFPASLQAEARKELTEVLKGLGHRVLHAGRQCHAARRGRDAGRRGSSTRTSCREHRGKFGGVILCLPNFGDETGAVAALQGRRRADPRPGLSGRTGQDGPGGPPRRLLRQVLHHGRLLPVRREVHRPQAAHGRARPAPPSPRTSTTSTASAGWSTA